MPYTTVASGDLLTAAIWNTNVRDQVVTTATTALRPSGTEGQVVYDTDTNQLLVYNGTAWVIPNSPAQNPQGLELITTCTATSTDGTSATATGGITTIGTGNTSVTVSSAFSATYDNYKIVANGGTTTHQTSISLALGSSVNTYYGAYIYASYATGTVLGATINNQSNFIYAGGADIAEINLNIELQNPFQAKFTTIQALSVGYANNRGTAVGEHETASSFSAFTLAPFTGTLTGGTIRVYGYRNS